MYSGVGEDWIQKVLFKKILLKPNHVQKTDLLDLTAAEL